MHASVLYSSSKGEIGWWILPLPKVLYETLSTLCAVTLLRCVTVTAFYITDRTPPPNNSASTDRKSSKTASRGEKTSASTTSKAAGGRNHSQATNGHSSSSKSSSHKTAAPPLKNKPKPSPIHFSELMKLAQKNSEQRRQHQQQIPSAHGERVSKEKGQTLAPPLPDGGQRKTKSASPAPAKKLIASRDRQQHSQPPPPTGSKAVVKKHSATNGLASSKLGNNSRGPQKDQRVSSTSDGSMTRGRGRGGGRGRGRVIPGFNPAKANSFYSATSSQLARSERARFQTKRPSFMPHSGVAGEMSDYMLHLEQERLLREEEGEDEYEEEEV